MPRKQTPNGNISVGLKQLNARLRHIDHRLNRIERLLIQPIGGKAKEAALRKRSQQLLREVMSAMDYGSQVTVLHQALKAIARKSWENGYKARQQRRAQR